MAGRHILWVDEMQIWANYWLTCNLVTNYKLVTWM